MSWKKKVCVCVCERERERRGVRESARKKSMFKNVKEHGAK